MAITHRDAYGATFALADGDQTVAALLAAAGISIFPGLKSGEIRVESAGPVAVAYDKTMTALTQGKQLSGLESATEHSVRFEQVDAGKLHIFAVGAADIAYIEVHSSL